MKEKINAGESKMKEKNDVKDNKVKEKKNVKENTVKEKKNAGDNKMRIIKIEKVVLHVGGIGDKLTKGVALLKIIGENQKVAKMQSRKRIPTLNVRPGLEIGGVITIRKGIDELLKRLLKSVENKLKRKQISENNFSFGVPEYIEIPGLEYQRDIGIIGLDVTVVFKRAGRRVGIKKIKRGKIPRRQVITKGEIIKIMEENFNTEFLGK
jgi:large subunit ribosomal protein L5